MVQVQIENGTYSFKLGDILRERGISINKLMRDTNTVEYNPPAQKEA